MRWLDRTEAKPHLYKNGWFYVGRKKCSFHSTEKSENGGSHVHGVPTKLIRKMLAKMDSENKRFPHS